MEIVYVADHVSLVLVPEAGDGIQVMKSGIFEVVDSFVVNKSDRPGAQTLAKEIQAQYEKPVWTLSAQKNHGLEPVVSFLEQQKNASSWLSQRQTPQRLQWEARSLLHDQLESQIQEKIRKIKTLNDIKSLLVP